MSDPQHTSRRGFMAAGLAALASASLPSLTRGTSEERTNEVGKILKSEAPLPKDRTELLEAIGSGSPFQVGDIRSVVAKNALIGAMWASAKLLTQEVLDHQGIESSHFMKHASDKAYLETLRSKPLETIIKTCVAAPLVEEAIFRMMPSQYLDSRGEHGLAWNVGIPVSALFTLAHNITFDKTKPLGVSFDCSSVSLPTFAAGLVYWYLQRTAGIDAAVVAHATSNSLQVAKLFMAATDASSGEIGPHKPEIS